ncbi:hypothetical protein ACTWPT_19580 [Nonomuraea sp. 3N208]|uniref:hypothetical protein n=1 Tax=Nonomuraea sp. 3N208 TaxID=3457421 RepID=UPI003FCD8420
MLKRSCLDLAVPCLVSAARCSAAADTPPAPKATGGSDKPRLIQSAMADCMKGKGFKYVPWIPKQDIPEESRKSGLGDYEAMRKERAESGFGVFINLADPSFYRDRAIWRESAAMGDCLKGKGYRVDSLRPSDMHIRGWEEFEAQKRQIALNDDLPEGRDMKGDRGYYEPRLPVAAAKQYLAKEVKAALDDLECGKDFYATYLPKFRQVENRVSVEFGGSGL